jgi:hypothetical protein
MARPQIFELSHGQLLSPAAVGKTIVHRPLRDAGSPLFLGLLYGVPGLGLLVAGGVMIAAGLPAMLLVVLVLLLGALFGWLAVGLLADAVAARRFNRRGYEVRFGLRNVEVRGPDGVERVTLAEALTHPFLRSLVIDGRVRTLLRVRAACMQLPNDDDVRVVLETLAVVEFDDGETSQTSEPPPCFAVVTGGAAIFTRDPEDVETGTPLYRVATEWDPAANEWHPRLTPAGVRRV